MEWSINEVSALIVAAVPIAGGILFLISKAITTVNAVQTLGPRSDKLEGRMDKLEGRMDKLEKKVDKILFVLSHKFKKRRRKR